MFKGSFLSLNGLTSIDKDVAQELAKFKGSLLSLHGVKDIEQDAIKELKKFEGRLRCNTRSRYRYFPPV